MGDGIELGRPLVVKCVALVNGQDDALAPYAKRERVVDAQADLDEHQAQYDLKYQDLEQPHSGNCTGLTARRQTVRGWTIP